jgi:hypothetical protein
VSADLRRREAPLKEIHQASVHGEDQSPFGSELLDQVGQGVGEHDLIANALLGEY